MHELKKRVSCVLLLLKLQNRWWNLSSSVEARTIIREVVGIVILSTIRAIEMRKLLHIDAVELVLPVRDVMICLDFQGIIAWNDFDFEANAGWSSEPRASASQLLHPPTTTTCLASTAPPSSTPHSATDDAQPTVAKPCSSVSPLLDDLSEAPP